MLCGLGGKLAHQPRNMQYRARGEKEVGIMPEESAVMDVGFVVVGWRVERTNSGLGSLETWVVNRGFHGAG
jgi:hypothetical protein